MVAITVLSEIEPQICLANSQIATASALVMPANGNNEVESELDGLRQRVSEIPAVDNLTFRNEMIKLAEELTTKANIVMQGAEKAEFKYKMTAFVNKLKYDKVTLPENFKAALTYEIDQVDNSILKSKRQALKNNATNDPEKELDTYNKLVKDFSTSEQKKAKANALTVSGEVRYHSSANQGKGRLDKDQSGIRTRVGVEQPLGEKWKANAMAELKTDMHNYDNKAEVNRFYLTGNLDEVKVTGGAFGYLMGDGNIYDSRFDGVKFDFGEKNKLKYSVAYGETNSSKDTYVTTFKYSDYDYAVDLGVYNYRLEDSDTQNRIANLGYNYYFSNFSFGAMYLHGKLKDEKKDNDGYVLGVKYGEVKTYRPKTYEFFMKYYDQAQSTYIAHGMNGIGARMRGFRGHSLGTNYSFMKNTVLGIEYYDLQDKVSGEEGKTLWGSVTYYF